MRLNSQDQSDRITWSIKAWNRMAFITATIPEYESDPRVISSRWSDFMRDIVRHWGRGIKSVRVLQRHPKGHGWHIHAVFNQYIPSGVLLHCAKLAGLGRMDFRMVQRDSRKTVCEYLSRYISRDMRKRDGVPKRTRMITATGAVTAVIKWWVRCSDIRIESTYPKLMKSLRLVMESHGCVLHDSFSSLQLFSIAPAEALREWRSLHPGLVY